jgi:hypothetical protein
MLKIHKTYCEQKNPAYPKLLTNTQQKPLISIEIAANQPCCGRDGAMAVPVCRSNTFCIVLALSCSKLREAEKANVG